MFIRLIPMIFLLTSCSAFFIRQECDKINWYQQGQDIAMRGDRISNDETVVKCRRAEAEMSESKLDQGFKAGMSLYCQPDTVFQTGKNGDNFNSEFCDTSNMNLLKKRHAEGILTYCKSGMTAGLSGRKYKNNCNGEQEKTFLPDYRKGRKKYLSALLMNEESKRRDINIDLVRLSSLKNANDYRLAALPLAAKDSDPYFNERMNLSNSNSSLNSEISQKTYSKSQIEKTIDEYQKELATLD